MIQARPFPWGTLDAISRDDLELARRFGRLLGATAWLGEASRALETLLGATTTLRLHAIEPVAAAADPQAVAVSLVVADVLWVVEAEATLAIEAVTRAAGRAAPAAAAGLDPSALTVTANAFGSLLTKTLRRARKDADVRVVGAGAASSVLATSDLADPIAAVYTLVLDTDAYRARLLFSRRLAAAAPEPPVGADALATLGAVRLRVPVVGACAWSTARELSSLRVGDAWMPGPSARAPSSVVLASACCDRGLAATLEEGDRLVLGNSTEDLTMTDAAQDTLLESVLDAPIVVRVELGSVELPAREWAALKAGDVVKLDRRIGAPVLLRAGGAELGQGELVDIDGEIGVRITALVTESR